MGGSRKNSLGQKASGRIIFELQLPANLAYDIQLWILCVQEAKRGSLDHSHLWRSLARVWHSVVLSRLSGNEAGAPYDYLDIAGASKNGAERPGLGHNTGDLQRAAWNNGAEPDPLMFSR